jgi:hypothetical protein
MINNIKNFILIFLSIIFILFIIANKDQDTKKLNTLEQNIFALNDSIRSYRTKNNELVFEKGALIIENGSLKSLNKSLYEDLKDLKDKPLVAIKTNLKIVHDTISIFTKSDEKRNSDGSLEKILNWEYEKKFNDNNYRKFSANSKIKIDTLHNLSIDSLHIIKDEIGLSLITGLTENGDYLEIFIKSNYPNFSPTKIDGALIEPTKSKILKKYFPSKKWGLSIYGGYGICINPEQTNPLYISRGLQLGIGVSYSIFQWNFKK